MTVGSLFSGVGGMDLGLERAGMSVKWQVEIDPFARKVLAKHWPNVARYEDVRTVGTELERVDLIAGGFPCQDLSVAGKRAGIDGERSGLWREFARLIGLLRPRFVLIENVPGLRANESMRRVLGDISALGYDAEWESIPAAAVGAPILRDRVWIFAFPGQELGGDEGRIDAFSGRDYLRTEADIRQEAQRGKDWELVALAPGIHKRSAADWWLRQSRVARSVNGIPRELVDAANGGYGNAVSPPVAEYIGRRIMQADALARCDREIAAAAKGDCVGAAIGWLDWSAEKREIERESKHDQIL